MMQNIRLFNVCEDLLASRDIKEPNVLNHPVHTDIKKPNGKGLMLWLFVRPTGVYLLDFFCSGIQF